MPTLLRVLWCNRRRVINLNPSPLLLPTIMEWQLPTTLVLRRAQPQSHQMPARCGWREVLVRSPRMQHVVIRQELDVANVENHVQCELEASVLEDLGGARLLRGKSRDQASVGEAG
jgi:hypothetical protein